MPQFRSKPQVVEAIRLTHPASLHFDDTVIRGEAGSWLVSPVDGEPFFVDEDAFSLRYEPIISSGAPAPTVKRARSKNLTLAQINTAFDMMAAGLSSREIAERLDISPNTVNQLRTGHREKYRAWQQKNMARLTGVAS